MYFSLPPYIFQQNVFANKVYLPGKCILLCQLPFSSHKIIPCHVSIQPLAVKSNNPFNLKSTQNLISLAIFIEQNIMTSCQEFPNFTIKMCILTNKRQHEIDPIQMSCKFGFSSVPIKCDNVIIKCCSRFLPTPLWHAMHHFQK